MSNDDLTNRLTNSDEEDLTTQPTITAVFRLLREVHERQAGLHSRFDALESSLNSRFEALESRLGEVEEGQASLNSRIAEMSDEMKNGLLQLSDKLYDKMDIIKAHGETDMENITRRLRKLESKAS